MTRTEQEEPPSSKKSLPQHKSSRTKKEESATSLFKKITQLFRRENTSLEKEVAELIEEHDPEGTQYTEEERNILHNALSINERRIDDIMVPRANIIAIDNTASLAEIKQVIIEKEHTRIPIYKKSIDTIVGFIHIKDLISHLDTKTPFEINNIKRDILCVPPSMKIINLLRKMKAQRVHIAIVLDEYGTTDGLVTLEDIMEEIVGEIEDEHDNSKRLDFTTIDTNTFEVSARLEVDDLEQKLGTTLRSNKEEEDYDTIGGLIFYLAGKVPKQGETIKHPSGLEFEITDADPRRIKRVLIKK